MTSADMIFLFVIWNGHGIVSNYVSSHVSSEEQRLLNSETDPADTWPLPWFQRRPVRPGGARQQLPAEGLPPGLTPWDGHPVVPRPPPLQRSHGTALYQAEAQRWWVFGWVSGMLWGQEWYGKIHLIFLYNIGQIFMFVA